MKISGIDEDFVDIIDYLNEKGLQPFASCDGVLEHHERGNEPTNAYISFMKSEKIIDVMSALSRDKSNFSIVFSGDSYTHPYELYGNMIEGNTYQVCFNNSKGELTEYFKKIVKGTVEGEISISDSEKERLIKLSEEIEKTKDSELKFSVELNREYQPYTDKDGKTNCLIIGTKNGLDYNRNMQELAQKISERFGIQCKKDDYSESFKEIDEFIVPCFDKCSLEYYFKEDDLSKVFEIIELAKMEEKNLTTFESKEPDYDEYNIE